MAGTAQQLDQLLFDELLFDEILIEGVKRNASGLHLKPGARPVLRVHGELESQSDLPPLTGEFMEAAALKLLGEHHFAELREGKEKDLAYLVPGTGRFRVNLFLARGEIRAVLRAVPSRIPRFEELHLPPMLEQLAMERRGLILVTGSAGCGKSTTLASMVDFMNRHRTDHIITIEDPVEFTHDDLRCVVSQREIEQDSASFVQALRAALREDPDVILVGEMRDTDTMAVALHAAETGHLVLSTLHTLNAAETVNRIIAAFPPHQEEQIRQQLASVIQGVVSQRLVVLADGNGRVPAVEVMVGTGLIRDCIRDRNRTPQLHAVIAAGQAQYGMQTFDQSLLALYEDQTVGYETAREAATNPDDFSLKVRGISSTGEITWEDPPGLHRPVGPTVPNPFLTASGARTLKGSGAPGRERPLHEGANGSSQR